jgi:hypothetical protein
MAELITLDTYKQMIKAGEAFNIAKSFNARVGDEQVPLVVKFLERGKAQQFEDGLVPFMSGFVGNLDDAGKVTAETGEPVSYTGTRSDIVGLGMVKMNLPGTMFPQEGYFYGFLGLETPDHSKRVSTFSVWFHVYNGNPDMFVNKEPFRSELQKELDRVEVLVEQTEGTIKAKLIEWEKLINDLITNKNINLEQLESRMATVEGNLKILEDKIKADNLVTVGDLNDLLAPFNDILDTLNNYRGLNQPWIKDRPSDVLTALSNYASTVSNDENVVRILNLQDIHATKSKTQAANYVTGGNAVINQLRSLDLIRDKVDMVVVNGDNIDGSESRKLNIHRNQQIVDTLHGVMQDKPVLFTMGNHDDGSVWKDGSEVLTLKELTDIYDYQFYNAGEIRPDNSASYAYYDFPNQKIRAISLSGFENPEVYNDDGTIKYKRGVASVFTTKQLNWLVQALKISSDWSVIIFNHSPYEGFYNNAPYSYITNLNHNVLKDILKAFVNGTKVASVGANTDFPANITADFSEQGEGTLITNVFGHEHRDAEKVVIDDIPAILRTCDIALTPDRVVGTSSEYGFDIIEIDVLKRKIKFNRFGAGESVSWSY